MAANQTQATTTFDAEKYKSTTKAQWEKAAEPWHRWGPTLRTWLGPATQQMLDLCNLRQGGAVLDVAAGAGEQTLAAARRVGPTGKVLATDISPRILEFAEQTAREAGFSNVTTQTADGEDLGLPEASFDAVISRVGLIYFPDQQNALRGFLRVLKPGGRFAGIVYSTPENNKFFSVPIGIIRRRANTPPPLPGQPGPFSLGAPGVLEQTLGQAGFRDVKTVRVPAPLRLPSAADCLRFERESFGALHQMLSPLGSAEQEAAWAEIGKALREFETNEGFVGPCELVIVVGTK
ncbi:MAG: class I SAM-dependent methyltransferase [Thermoplasmatota archaeon]